MKTESKITEKPAVVLTGCYVKSLISMTEFVLNQEGAKFEGKGRWDDARLTSILNYAKFLSQPLTLGMFIPCDLEGNVLEEPEMIQVQSNPYECDVMWDEVEVNQYIQAKSRVIFKGFEFREKDTDLQKASICWQNILHVYWQDSIDGNWRLSKGLKIVEDLVKYGLSVNDKL